MRILIPLALLAAPAFAQCPPSPDIAAEEDALFAEIAEAGSPMTAREMSDDLWRLWTQAPDEAAQEMLDEAMRRARVSDLLGARESLTDLIAYCPDYAEGWNQRAFVAFRVQDYEAALADLDRAEKLNPRHLGVLTGKALTLINMGREAEAVPVLRAALALNPYLSERALLDGILGQDI